MTADDELDQRPRRLAREAWDGITPVYQPIVRLADRRVIGYEALARGRARLAAGDAPTASSPWPARRAW